MVNDTTTLNGALQELGETMAANLVTQGVQASASDGLTTLAGKILDIQTGGGSCYHIEFSSSSYTAVGGSATLEVYLQSNYAPLSGATVSVVGSDSSLYTGITDSSGVATVTVSVNSETTFTATYNNVTDTCTVTVPTYLFYDGGVTGNVNTNYTNISNRCTISTTSTGTKVSSTKSYDSFYRENVLIQGDFRAEFIVVDVVAYGELAFLNTSNSNQFHVGYDKVSNKIKFYQSGTESQLSTDVTMGKTLSFERINTTLKVYLDGTQIGNAQTVTSADGYLAWKTHSDRSRSITFKEFKVTAL